MDYHAIVWRNSMRNRRRTFLTTFSVALAVFVLCVLVTFVNEIDNTVEATNPLRLMTRHAVSFAQFLPGRQRAEIEKVPGVVAVTPVTWFGGIYIDEGHTDFSQFACDPRTLFDVYTDITIPLEQREVFIRERTAVVVGRRKAEKHGWKVGQRIPLQGTVFPVDLELTIRGVFIGSLNDESNVFFHHAYLEEALDWSGFPGGFAMMYSVRADSIESLPRVIDAIDTKFRNSDAPTKTETEKAFHVGFFNMLGNLKGLVAGISSIILFAILLVSANTMALSVRERMSEIAVMRSLGFGRRTILALLLSEGMLISSAGGLLGCLAAYLLLTRFTLIDIAALTLNNIQRFEVTLGVVAIGLFISIALGILSTAVPAYRALRMSVADGLRHVG